MQNAPWTRYAVPAAALVALGLSSCKDEGSGAAQKPGITPAAPASSPAPSPPGPSATGPDPSMPGMPPGGPGGPPPGMPPGMPPPGMPPPRQGPKIEYVVPRLLFVVAGSEDLTDAKGPKLEAINTALNKMTRRLMDYYDVGLVQTGHLAPDACGDVKTTTAAGFKVKEPIELALGLARPVTKKRSIAAALESIRSSAMAEKPKTMVVLITTGADGCGADGCAAVKKLKEASTDLVLHVVDVGGEKSERAGLECMATAGGGKLLTAKDDADVEVQLEIALGKDICPPMAMPCWEQGFESPVVAQRMLVIEHCCSLESPVAFRCPYKAMNDAELGVRKAAFQCILDKPWSRKEEALALALHDADVGMRRMVVEDLEKNPPSDRLKDVLLKAVEDADAEVRRRAGTVAARTIAGWTKSTLYKAVEDKDAAVRVAVVDALKGRFDEVAFDVLNKAADDKDAKVKTAVVEILAGSNDKRALVGLEKLGKDKTPVKGKGTVGGIASKAAETLKKKP